MVVRVFVVLFYRPIAVAEKLPVYTVVLSFGRIGRFFPIIFIFSLFLE
jgi:hypothetical protein